MKTPQIVRDILQKPMDRKDFLKHIGIAGLFVMGGGVILKSLVNFSEFDKQNNSRLVATGGGRRNIYGRSSYGN